MLSRMYEATFIPPSAFVVVATLKLTTKSIGVAPLTDACCTHTCVIGCGLDFSIGTSAEVEGKKSKGVFMGRR